MRNALTSAIRKLILTGVEQKTWSHSTTFWRSNSLPCFLVYILKRKLPKNIFTHSVTHHSVRRKYESRWTDSYRSSDNGFITIDELSSPDICRNRNLLKIASRLPFGNILGNILLLFYISVCCLVCRVSKFIRCTIIFLTCMKYENNFRGMWVIK